MPRYFQNRLEFAPAFRSGKQATRREEVAASRTLLFVSTEQPDAPLPLFVVVAARATDESAASHTAAKRAGGDLLAWIERHRTEYKTVPELLHAAVSQANHKIVEDKQVRGAAATVGASLALAAFVEQGQEFLRLCVVYIGTGRVYLVRQAKVHLLTADHSAVRVYLDGGYMRWSEAVKQPNHAELKRFLGKQWLEEGDGTLIPPAARVPWNPDEPVPANRVESIALQKNDQVWLVTPTPYDLLGGAQLQGLVDASPARTATGLVKLVTTNGAAAAVVRWRDRNWRWLLALLPALLLLGIVTFGITWWSCSQDRLPIRPVCEPVAAGGKQLSAIFAPILASATPTPTVTSPTTITLTTAITSLTAITPTQTPAPSLTPAATETALASPTTAAPPPTPSPTPTATRTPTPRPTNTATLTPMPTSTFIPPATFTPTPTFTPTLVPATATPILPTPTAGLTATATPEDGDLATTTPTGSEPVLPTPTTITATATISKTSVLQSIRPALLPDRAALSAVVGEKVTFEWRHDNQLAPGLGFELRIWRAGEYHAGAYDAVKTADEVRCENGICQLTIGWPEGEYQWAVAVVHTEPYSRELFDLESQPPGTLRIAAPSRPEQPQSDCNENLEDC